MRARLARTAPAALLVVLAVAGCSSSAGNPATAGSVSVPAGGGPTSPPPTSPPPTSPPPGTGDTVTISDRDDGRTVTVHVGQQVRVVLHSVYWTIGQPSDPGVLAPAVAASKSPSPGCVPGAGCGTVTQEFLARAVGTSVVSASRFSCGEVKRCMGGEGRFRVTVAVTS